MSYFKYRRRHVALKYSCVDSSGHAISFHVAIITILPFFLYTVIYDIILYTTIAFINETEEILTGFQ